jgi:Zn-dependent M28 family amino/carboxypeptidase
VSAYATNAPTIPAQITVAVEDYNRLVRMSQLGEKLKMAVDLQVQFHTNDLMGYNTIAEIPGSDLKDEIVMVGGHLDSWHSGTGATDNAAGSAVAMEAVRILQALRVKPKRTIRIGLWTGEEQGLLGSRAYVKEHLGSRAEPEDPEERKLPSYLRTSPPGPLSVKPDHARLYTQGNLAAVPIFEAWLKPLADLGATTVTNRSTGGTDHLAFDGVGLPGFQFIQDEADYETRTHHTNVDVYDRMQKDDLMQAAVVMASFVYHAAMREERFPRKAMPAEGR